MMNEIDQIEIRKFQGQKEFDEIVALNLVEWGVNCFGSEEQALKSTREHFNDPLRHTLVAVLNGKVVGTVCVVEHDVYSIYGGLNIRESNLGYLSRLVVQKAFRAQGIGRQLLTASDKLAADLGFKNLFLFMLEGRDTDLCRMYLKYGWKIEAEKEVGSFGQCLILAKEVPGPQLRLRK